MSLSPDVLAARYDDHYRKAERIEISAERFEKGIERGDDGEWGAGCLAIDDGRILLVREGDAWLVPGGRVESDESPVAAARREVLEETGIEVEITGLGAIAEQTFVHEETGESFEFYFATFVGTPAEHDPTFGPEPGIDEVAWHDDVPENTFDGELVERLAAEYTE
ncbi:NUDIX hydrolase [Natronomonas halophila]|uniref:NUDIX hydrolase n=1 Tax=Natronomonas halophila TaxID=2747817 RepID=UPI0015B435E6|nr:NUDIX hydrolase [Natronomonas halophila]QLD84827.1 NUDIX hydrolase [Natronomonas halophila]